MGLRRPGNDSPGRGGEIQLTDALHPLAVADGEGAGISGVIFRGRRFDRGDKLSYIKAVITLALERKDMGPALDGDCYPSACRSELGVNS